jgi:ribosomal protein S18 acetylase RimI-like enzyme
MSKIELITDVDKYKISLMSIYNESIEYFMEVEGRRPLSPFDDIYGVAGIPKDNPVQCYAFLFEGEIVGYSWVMEDISDELYYILHFSIADSFRRQKLGTRALQAIEDMYKNYEKSELLVSSKNYYGLNFWVKNGYTEITWVFPSEEQKTVSTELNLRKYIHR